MSAKRNRNNARISPDAITDVARRIAEKFDPEQIVLFGSYAYGKPNLESDVDLLIVMNTKQRPLAKQLEIARALSPHPFGMDILVRSPAQIKQRIAMGDYFLRAITAKGKLLYERHRR
ncbi:MAG: nucleotidyltransferase domain-containing protein [Chloroflexi bacterium]|nr:nucleotidyltransferase domain-containing protein [Chloroflexota bacterium]MBI3740359.1 nucleotidyltransferase domain-containing protein [Chloroflexota bacterium]